MVADGLVRQEFVVADGPVREEFMVVDGLGRQECQCGWYGCVGMYGSRFCLVTRHSSFWGKMPWL